MALIEEWRWEKSDENPLQPLWDFMIDYLKTEFERMEKEKREMENENIWNELEKIVNLDSFIV